jgi:uncharacterized protein YecE (DUF72 family)
MFQAATGEVAAISLADIDLFKKSLEPLAASHKLVALLAQFPPSFINDGRNRQLLEAVINHFGAYGLAVELRHRSWSDDARTSTLLKKGNVCWVEIDEPKFSFSVATGVPQTANLAYLRFHGRNTEMWWKGDAETRYMYLYSEEEIAGLATRVKAASEKAGLTLVFFNNHWQAYAPRNANDLKKALQLPLRDFALPRLLD